AADMNGAGAQAPRISPGNWTIERPVEFEDTRTISIVFELVAIAGRKALPGDGEQLPWGDVEQIRSRRRQVGHRPDSPSGMDAASKRLQVSRERVCDFLRAAPRHRPAVGVATHAQHQRVAARREVL